MSSILWIPRLLVVTALIVIYYRFAKQALFALAPKVIRLAPGWARRRWSSSELVGLVELAFAASSHVVIVSTLFAVSGMPLTTLGLASTSVYLLPLGLLVGIGEAAASMFVCQLVILWVNRDTAPRATDSPRPRRAGSAVSTDVRDELRTSTETWSTMSRGGWVRHHLTTLRAFPVPVSVLLSTTQVACEEIVFRVFVIYTFMDLGVVAAVILSGLLFTGMQIFFMGSWRSAMFPVVGAAIMSAVHGVLITIGGGVLPLIAAHAVFFFASVL